MCVVVMKTSHKVRKWIRCPIKWCECKHANRGHGPGGCGGETLKGAVWHPCKCETFRLAENQERPEAMIRHSMIFGTHQG